MTGWFARGVLALARGAAVAAMAPVLALAQPASERGMVAQTVDGTTITIEYYRPVARGRTPFPDVVHWGRTWAAGANWATTFEVDKPIHLNGNPVPKGKYSIWMIPTADEWTVILSREARRFHTQPPGSGDEQMRFTMKPATGPHLETLTFSFPVVTRDGATLEMHWGTTIIPMRITVEPSRPLVLSDSERARYVGRYRLTPNDSVPNFAETTLVVTDSAGALHARATPPLWGYDEAVDLLATGQDDEFRLAFYHDGKPFGMETEARLVFTQPGGHATGFDLFAFTRLLGRATREN